MTTTTTQQPRFPLGRIVATPGALREIPHQDIEIALARHARADWGDVCGEDKAENDFSLTNGLRLLSVYHTGSTKFWIITDADRSATTVLLPDEY